MTNKVTSQLNQVEVKDDRPWNARIVGVFLAVFALVGLFCSAMLLASELAILNDPNVALSCDINPLIGCSSSLTSPQAHLLGLPNSSIGMLLFGMLLGLAAVLVLGGTLPRLVWWGMLIGATAGLGYVIYFLIQSVTVFGALCPYCMGVWAAILGFLPLAWGGAGASGALGDSGRAAGHALLKYWWALVLALYLLVVLVIVVTMSDKVALLFS